MSLVLDALILLLTWAKTYTIWRDALSAQINAPVSVLLLRDGTSANFCGVSVLIDIYLGTLHFRQGRSSFERQVCTATHMPTAFSSR